MIKTLSPNYKNIPWINPSTAIISKKYDLNIYIWNGLISSPPSTPTLIEQNINPLLRTDISKVDISRYVNSYLEPALNNSQVTSISSANASVWVKTEVVYYIDNVAQTEQQIEVLGAIKGYGYGIEGENTTIPVNGYLATQIEQKVYKNGVYIFNFL